ncbi:DUF3833 domain-containing protein [Herbaspirillum sp. RTI4]|uniref:DUF3833 domain-containing protein n=1 Tax=Herbaspirillum sp. RTI4 TaxID=3048640 RepID=UPI002AB59833|nr:DUF3833 domain-containing protein [Herbaspirillum sp. RTI4]MDY7577009.1 DUF3833 domain-containing protein [Herbaspirillum sp. RTI4]MEA9983080.1 DUF3833 domain-containing protein [Herbaspirillum sp. RTI4]
MKIKNVCAYVVVAAAATLLSACSTPAPVEHYAAEQPTLDMQRYFNGKLEAHGMFQDRSGTVIKRFVVQMICHWEGETGTLDEDFTYSDGTKQKRVWTLRKVAPGRFIGTAPDVVGEAIGVVAGNTLHWSYVLALPVDGKIINVDFDDWMILIDQRVMLNRATMSKYGFNLGAVTLSFDKQEQAVLPK